MPKAPREIFRNTSAGPTFLAGFSKWHLSAKATSLNDGKLKQRHLRPNFTGQIFIATSRCQTPTSDHFLILHDARNSGTQPNQRKACQRYRTLILKKFAAPRLLGKDFKGENHKPSRNLIKLVGC